MEELQNEYKELSKKKEDIEAQLTELNEILTSNDDVGMKGALVDTQGYPRSDIDVYSVRHTRHQVICLTNDHKALMQNIEDKLYQIHDCARKTQTVSNGSQSAVSAADTNKLLPFLKVTKVVTASPAAQAGLITEDYIKQFGSVTATNFKNLQDIALVVQHSKDKVVKLVVDRDGQEHRLELIPRVWSGRGLLGCSVIDIPPGEIKGK